ncbi:hypothetical protein L226DRAFT_76045 [Lentinus tigrinus ALCF2SS1-7]|uniref:uncharacterized protein n=1 Tax=Lentinus tigrinus ALCF2SS1-7 TaxID=1328758 RepID=UPI0011660D67|nr:hypothetical protein L226DRAFT_76045 [Lentinus tigrinus ALCF2SS1-7]
MPCLSRMVIDVGVWSSPTKDETGPLTQQNALRKRQVHASGQQHPVWNGVVRALRRLARTLHNFSASGLHVINATQVGPTMSPYSAVGPTTRSASCICTTRQVPCLFVGCRHVAPQPLLRAIICYRGTKTGDTLSGCPSTKLLRARFAQSVASESSGAQSSRVLEAARRCASNHLELRGVSPSQPSAEALKPERRQERRQRTGPARKLRAYYIYTVRHRVSTFQCVVQAKQASV